MRIQVTVLHEAGPDGGHKFKLSGLIVSDEPFHRSMPFLGAGQTMDDYVEAKVGGRAPLSSPAP